MNLEIYNESKKNLWNEFVYKSKNATFLFFREYMDYHKDRFTDNSFMIYDEKNNLIGLLPANINDNELISHGGLTYGGFLIDKKIRTPNMLKMFDLLIKYCKENNINKIIYKTIPYIYHEAPSQEDLYALFINNAKLYIRNVSSSIRLSFNNDFETRRKRQIKKAENSNILVCECEAYESYWDILETNLMKNHQTKPAHTINEIKRLHSQFPENIKLFCAFKDKILLSGVLIYESKKTVHVQYIAASEEGKKLGALDIIFHKLVKETYTDKEYFDFGISNENKGRYLNEGLINQKEGFGASAIVYDQYIIEI
jgi:hypothetical protein